MSRSISFGSWAAAWRATSNAANKSVPRCLRGVAATRHARRGRPAARFERTFRQRHTVLAPALHACASRSMRCIATLLDPCVRFAPNSGPKRCIAECPTCADCVAKLGEGRLARNIRIGMGRRLNQGCASTPDLESILLAEASQNSFATVSATRRHMQCSKRTD